MSASSPLSTPPLRVDHLIHDLYREAAARAGDLAESVRSDVALDDSPPTSEREGEVCSVVEDGSEAAHWGSGAVHVAEGVRASPAGTALVPAGSTLAFAAMAAAPVALGTTMVCGAANELNAGDIGNAQVQYDRMRGMLAALEGRSASALEGRTESEPEVAAEARRNSAYRRGIEDVENATPAMRARARAAVRESREDAFTLVSLGRDHGPTFTRRYHRDLAFHHAVDYARRCRDENRPEWHAIHERTAAYQEAMTNAALRAPIRG